MRTISAESLKQLRDTLLSRCESVVELDRRAVLEAWRRWREAFPLETKQHRAILEDTVAARIERVRTSLKDRHAIGAYEQQSGEDLIVLVDGTLVGWAYRGNHVPDIHDVDANVLVTTDGFEWRLGRTRNGSEACTVQSS